MEVRAMLLPRLAANPIRVAVCRLKSQGEFRVADMATTGQGDLPIYVNSVYQPFSKLRRLTGF